jgi:MFS family permease
MAQVKFYGWKLVAALWLIVFINLAFAAYGSPVMNAAMATQLHWNRTLAGLPYATYTVMSGVPALLVAVLVRYIGVRWTVVLGTCLILIGALSMATIVHSATGALIAFGLFVGLGVAWGGPFGVQPGVVNWFVRRRALALAIVYSAGGVGGLIAARLLNRLITSAGGDWRAGWWLYAGLATIALVVAAAAIRDRPADLGQAPDGDAGPADAAAVGASAAPVRSIPAFITREVWSFGEVVRSGKFWIMVLTLCGGSAGYTLFLAQGMLHLADLGHTTAQAATAVSLTTGSTLLGKIALGALGDRVDPRYIWSVTMAVFGIGLVTVVGARSMASVYLFSVCIGFGFGGGLVCMMSVLSNYYGPRVFPAAAGLSGALNTLVSFCLSVGGGRIYDEVGSYAPTFYSLAIWCFAGAIALLLVRAPLRGVAPDAGAVALAGGPERAARRIP